MNTDQTDEIRYKLLKKVEKLQISCNFELEKQAQASNIEHLNMASMYFWWLEASNISGFLESEYAKLMSRKLRAVSYGINYRGILLKFYGNMIGDAAIDRKSRVLNQLNKEVIKNKDLYKKDGVKKLAQFIENSGGMVGLYLPTYDGFGDDLEYDTLDDEENETDDLANSQPKKRYMEVVTVSITNDQRTKCLKDDANRFFAKNNKLKKVQIAPDLNTEENEFVVIAAKKVNGKYEILELQKNQKQIDSAVVSAYRKQFSALPNSVRCIFETIKSQCLTNKSAKHMDKALIEPKSYQNPKLNYRNTPAKRRLTYSYERGELILSPIDYEDNDGRIVGGMVTIAKPKTKIFEHAYSDLYMPLIDRRVIEQRLIAPNDINLFKPSSDATFNRYYKFDGDISHLIRLDSKLNNGDFIFLNFYGFGEDDPSKLLPQVIYDQEHELKITKIFLPVNEVVKIADLLAKKWINDIGENINRTQHRFWELMFRRDGIQIAFDEHIGDFERDDLVLFDMPLSVDPDFSGLFFTHELAPLLITLAELDINSEIEVQLNDAGMVFKYATDAADYTVAIPKWDGLNDNRHVEFLNLYTPERCGVRVDEFEFDEYDLGDEFYKGLELLGLKDKSEAEAIYKKQIINEQSELADGFPELSGNINWITDDTSDE